LTHAQKLGISYSDEEGSDIEQTSDGHEHHDESAIESSAQAQSSNIILISHPVASQQDQALESRSGHGDHADIVVTADSDSDSVSDSMSHDNNDGSLGANTEQLIEDTKRTSKHSEDEDIAQNLKLEDIS
jgi:mannosidase alpha-like ER degradation enhancer 2